MIPFDYSKLVFKPIRIKSVSGVQQGRVTYLDETVKSTGKEVFISEKIPNHVVRAFDNSSATFVTVRGAKNKDKRIKEKAIRQFMTPVIGAIIKYQGVAVALERHPLGNLAEGTLSGDVWSSYAEDNFEEFVKPLVKTGKWFIDGSYIYRLLEADPSKWQQVSNDGHFRAVPAETIRIANLSRRKKDFSQVKDERICLAYVASNGQYSISPPIWKSLATIGSRVGENFGDQIDAEDSSYNGRTDTDHIDKIDDSLCVNLAFVLRAGKELADVFGYDAIEPLNLPQLMLKLRTVNLPNVHVSVKSTYNSGIQFSHMASWLLGLLRRTDTLESYLVIRSLLKYLASKGVYFADAFDPDLIFKKGQSIDTVPLLTKDEAAGDKPVDVDEVLEDTPSELIHI